MNWWNIIKFTKTPEMRLYELWMQRGGFIDNVIYTPEYPMGRPWDKTANTLRFFYWQDEKDWTENEKKEGREKSIDNPYIAPNWRPERYADFTLHSPDLQFKGGSRELFNLIEELWEQAKRGD